MSTQNIIWWGACDPHNPCNPCGPTTFDSGGAVLMEQFGCRGNWELVAVVRTGQEGSRFAALQDNPAFPLPSPFDPCPADYNNDGIVDGLDIGILLANWSPEPESVPIMPACAPSTEFYADLNCDLRVDGLDIGILLASWGSCNQSFSCPCESCHGGQLMISGSSPLESSAWSSDAFYQWALQATIEELFNWLQAGSWPGIISQD